MLMGRYFCLFTFVLTLAVTPRSFAQQHPVLPEQFAGWKATGPATSGAPTDAGSFAPAQAGQNAAPSALPAPLYAETGAKWAERRTYGQRTNQISAEAIVLRDPSSAYEFYTAQLAPGMAASTVGEYSALDANKLVALVGDVVLQVEQPRKIPAPDLEQLVNVIKARAHESPLPPIRAFLPEEDLVNGSQRYALGVAGLRNALEPHISSIVGTQNVEDAQREQYLHIADQIGFSSGAETMLARYQGNKGSAVLLLIDYPTPQLAELHLRHLQTALPDDPSAAKVTIERKGSLLSLMLTSSSPEYADALRASINFHTQVTWNEPSATATDPPWSVVLYRIFVGTGVFMVLAIILGIMFGGIRVMTKRYLPGKIFDRPKNIEILQLGLSGKRIDPSDFY
jgi:hypothetical protein